MRNFEQLIAESDQLEDILLELLSEYTVQELISMIKSVDAKRALGILEEKPLAYVGEEKSG